MNKRYLLSLVGGLGIGFFLIGPLVMASWSVASSLSGADPHFQPAAATEPAHAQPALVGAVDGPRDQIRAWVDERLSERRRDFQPTDEEIDAAMNGVMRGERSAGGAEGAGWFAVAIARVVWKALKVAVAALLLAAIVSLIWSHWYYLAAGAAAVAAWIEWRARSAAARIQRGQAK